MSHVVDTSLLVRQADLRSATRPDSANGLGLSVDQADTERQRLEAIFTLLPTPSGLYRRWIWLVNQYGVSGKPTHDAHIMAMLEHGLTHILTFNIIRDFQRYASLGIVAVDPATVQ